MNHSIGETYGSANSGDDPVSSDVSGLREDPVILGLLRSTQAIEAATDLVGAPLDIWGLPQLPCASPFVNRCMRRTGLLTSTVFPFLARGSPGAEGGSTGSPCSQESSFLTSRNQGRGTSLCGPERIISSPSGSKARTGAGESRSVLEFGSASYR